MAIIGLLVGLPSGWAVGRLFKAARIPSLPWSDEGALGLSLVFFAAGLLMTFLSLDRRGRAILSNPSAPDFGRAVKPAETAFLVMQAGVLMLAGLMLAAPVALSVIFKSAQNQYAVPVMMAVIACFVLQTALNLLIWRQADEVFRGVIVGSGAASFWLLQGAFFLWACGERLALLPKISSWDAVTVLMGGYLLTSTVVAYRRGLG